MNQEFLWKGFHLDKIKPSWNSFFQHEAKKDYFFPLLAKLEEEYRNYNCWPSKENIFRLFQEISLEKIKVVILGQDPYHSPGVADGIAFSTQKERYIPPSLKNIFSELSNNLTCSNPTKGNLLPWVKEGVFLLNTALTVREGKASSHMDWWKKFTYSLIKYLNNSELIWVFWGKKAKEIGKECEISEVYSLFSAHPAYSFYWIASKRTEGMKENNFLGSQVFSKINHLLSELKREPINWLSILKN